MLRQSIWSIGQTGCNFTNRRTEHVRDTQAETNLIKILNTHILNKQHEYGAINETMEVLNRLEKVKSWLYVKDFLCTNTVT